MVKRGTRNSLTDTVRHLPTECTAKQSCLDLGGRCAKTCAEDQVEVEGDRCEGQGCKCCVKPGKYNIVDTVYTSQIPEMHYESR